MITKDDLKNYRAFKTLVSKTKIEVSGEAVILAASLMQWFNELEQKLSFCQAHFELQGMKEKQEPIKQEEKDKKK